MKWLRLMSWRRDVAVGSALILLLVVSLLVLLYFVIFNSTPQTDTDPEKVSQFSRTAVTENWKLRKRCDVGGNQIEPFQDLQDKLIRSEKLLNTNQSDFAAKEEPNRRYEKLRRRIRTDAKELWFSFKSEVKKMQEEATDLSPSLATKLTHLLETGVEQHRAMFNDIDKLTDVDGYADWREKEAAELSDLIQRRLKFLQNPPDCGTAKKVFCNLSIEGCGFGCQLHHVVHCFIIAYGTERTLILQSKGWNYQGQGWEEVFLPVSDTCTDIAGNTRSLWPGTPEIQVVDVPVLYTFNRSAKYLLRAIPQDLAPRLERLHGDPVVWWIGQFLKYMMRPQESTSMLLKKSATKLGFKRPIVGVHIRRTDKVDLEADVHSLDEYMEHVDEYYNQLELRQTVDKRRIYLATDDPEVISEAKINYPNYEIIGDPDVAKTASASSRYTVSSLNGIIVDMHFLSRSDFIVCTFSSNVCRTAYEIMQTLHVDASDRFRSLDDIYYYECQTSQRRVAVSSNHARRTNEMDLEVGDLIDVDSNHWDGYSQGRNLRTNKTALYPSFKVDDVVDKGEFPTYPQVPLKVG